MQDETTAFEVPKDFVHRTLPWVVAGVALLVYGLTLSPWPTLYGLPTMARFSGWEWRPVIYGPVHYFVTYPIRWLPDAWQLMAWKLFSVGCAAAALGLLARTVSLLPHDRTLDQRVRERSEHSLLSLPVAWLPPVFAVLVCGLQLSFWEHAVEASIEMLDLVLFAYVVRCLLEHRIDQRKSWLYKSAFVYGLGMSSNVAMVAFLPVWLIALVWICGRAFFNVRFLARMAGLGLAGLVFYLVLPVLALASGLTEQSFGEMMRAVLGYQRGVVLGTPRYLVLLMSLTSVAPVAFIGIRWPEHIGDISAAGRALANFMMHLIHAVFLAACLYVSFDPAFSPRRLMGGAFVHLPLYYLGALAVGYCTGYFLLVFGKAPAVKGWRPSPLRRLLSPALVAAVGVACVAVPLGLAVRNLPQLRTTALREMGLFAQAAVRQLPAGAAVLSDETMVLHLLRVAMKQQGRRADLLLIDTVALLEPGYHRWLRRRHPQWPAVPDPGPGAKMDQRHLMALVAELSQSRSLFYLQPSFGYYMEDFCLKAAGPVYQMVRLPPGSVSPPPTPVSELEPSAQFWRQFKAQHLGGLSRAMQAAVAQTKAKAKAKEALSLTAATFYSAAVFSRGLNFLGVEFQKAGALEQAAEFFSAALELNPDNPTAYLNQQFNAVLRGQAKPEAGPSEEVQKRLAPYRGNWDSILGLNGPADEPNTYFLLARAFANNGLHRQAARCLERTLAMVPTDPTVRLALANAYAAAGLPDRALDLLGSLRAQTNPERPSEVAEVALAQAEAWAYAAKKDFAKAEQLLRGIQDRYPQNPTGFSTLAELYLRDGRYKEAIPVLERQVQIQKTNVNAMVNLAALYMRDGAAQKAIELLDRALSLQPDSVPARMNRAIAHMSLKHLDEAQRDYEALLLTVRNPDARIHYGLGEVYAAKGLRKRAAEQYRKYLKIAPPNTPEAKYVRDRLKALQ